MDVKRMSRSELEQEVIALRERCLWLERERAAEAALRHDLALQVVEARNKLAASKTKIKSVIDETMSGLQVKTLSLASHIR
jgi:hypothetical protein